eukprot:scaffold4577_cov135-Isochrysis_galbana.AAC.3
MIHAVVTCRGSKMMPSSAPLTESNSANCSPTSAKTRAQRTGRPRYRLATPPCHTSSQAQARLFLKLRDGWQGGRETMKR